MSFMNKDVVSQHVSYQALREHFKPRVQKSSDFGIATISWVSLNLMLRSCQRSGDTDLRHLHLLVTHESYEMNVNGSRKRGQ